VPALSAPVLIVAALTVGALAVAACSSAGPRSAPTTGTGPATTTTVATTTPFPTTTTVAAATTAAPTTTTPALSPQPTPLAAASALLAAWRAGDRAGAGRVATPAAVAALFAGAPQAYTDRGCQDPLNGTSACAFGAGSGLIQLQTLNVPAGWIVQSVTVNS